MSTFIINYSFIKNDHFSKATLVACLHSLSWEGLATIITIKFHSYREKTVSTYIAGQYASYVAQKVSPRIRCVDYVQDIDVLL